MTTYILITTGIFLFILLYILYNIFQLQSFLSKENIIEAMEDIYKNIEANQKQEFNNFLNEQKKEYISNQNDILVNLSQKIKNVDEKLKIFDEEMEKIEKTIKKLENTIIKEQQTFDKFITNRVEKQEKIVKNLETKLQNSTYKIAQLNNQLIKCKRKLKG